MPHFFQPNHEFSFDKVVVKHTSGKVAQEVAHVCSTCGKKATIFVSQVDAFGKVTQKKFCLYHAITAGLFHPKAWELLDGASMLHNPASELVCRCGMSASLLRSKGRAGCPLCYTTFAGLIKPLLPKIQNATAHAGKAPHGEPFQIPLRRRVELLERAMKAAVSLEDYEEAAVIRDQLASLQKPAVPTPSHVETQESVAR